MITPGTKLGRYEIVAPLGSGGMGEVYRARDTSIGRSVAAKVLPSQFSRDRDRLRRFEQEARAAGILNHPNILAIYDVGIHEGMPYIVAELLEGETLRRRLRHGPLSVQAATAYALQILQGLAAAHDKGIIHRDLKPENLFVCNDGRMKILDFGLAKLTLPEPVNAAAGDLSSLSETRTGALIGTLAYMSPEQLRGLSSDHRSDLFSFGAVLFEMLSGKHPFARDTAADTASAILKEEPPALSDSEIPPMLNRIIRHCLEKDQKKRFQSASDLAFDLESASDISSADATSAASASHSRARLWPHRVHRLLWLSAGLVLLALAVAAALWFGVKGFAPPPKSAAVHVYRLTDLVGIEESPAVSPDGKSLAFVADTAGNRQIWLRLLAGGAPLQITHDAGDHLFPRWSEDSASLSYYTPPANGESQGTLWEISALGGAPRRLSSSVSGADTSHDGNKLAFFRFNQDRVELVVTDRNASNARVLVRLDPQLMYLHPRWSPDDRWIAYQAAQMLIDDLFAISASGGKPKQLTDDSNLTSGFAWLPDSSSIVYSSARGSTILYLPTMNLWLARLKDWKPQQLTYGETSYRDPDVDRNGRVFASRLRLQFDIWKFPVGGTPSQNVREALQITHQTGQVQTPSVGPADQELAYLSDTGGHGNIWVMKLNSGEARQITYEKDPNVTLGVPIWSPDGKNITFAFIRGSWQMVEYWLVSPDGSNLRNVIPSGSWATWSGDGRWIYYADSTTVDGSTRNAVLKVPVEGGTPTPVRTDDAISPAIAPDGSALYYVKPRRNVNGLLDYELRVARPETGPSKVLAFISGDRIPHWQGLHPVISHNGNWLALPLSDELGTDIWVMANSDGKLRRITDFGQKRTFIARRLSWSSDDRYLFAAVGEGDADIVLFEGLLSSAAARVDR